MADWSSLPSELVRHIADCLLDTNDLDCYMDFRAVCPKWRSDTDDPKNSSELRFRPHRWIVIDEVFQSDARLLVNTVSGRVVRKELPLLGNYHFIATTHGGFFILADKEAPHAASVLNPFTGHTIRFKAPVPSHGEFSAAALSGRLTKMLPLSFGASELSSSPALVLLSDDGHTQYMAAPDSNYFPGFMAEDAEDENAYILMQLAIASGICATGSWQRTVVPLPVVVANKIFSMMKLFKISRSSLFSDKLVTGFPNRPGTKNANQFFLLESAGELLAIIKLQQHLKVFRLDSVTDEVQPVKSIGDRTIFVGYRRCLYVTAHKFPSVVANCIYYVKSTDSTLDIYQYDLETEKEERVSEAIDSLNPVTLSFANTPFTMVQLLSSYTINVQESQLAMEPFKLDFTVDDDDPYLTDGSYSDMYIDVDDLYF